MRTKLFGATLVIALLLTGCGSATADPGVPASGGAALGSTVPPGTDKQLLPEAVWRTLESMKNQEGTRVVTAGDDAYAVITAGEKPGYLVEVISTDKTGGQIEVVYAIYKPGAASSATITHPYNAYLLKGEARTPVTFRKTDPSQR